MICVYFFDIPVYRITEKRYYDERQKDVIITISGVEASQADMSESHLYVYNNQKSFLEQRYGGSWEFNEIVGFIKLHFLGGQIRGEYFTTKPNRKVRTRKKLFIYSTHKLAPEVNIPRASTNAEIFQKILHYIERCKDELPSSRYIDDKHIECIGPYIDWKELIVNAENELHTGGIK